MKTHLTLTSSIYALLISAAVASPTWETGNYTPATWESAEENVLRGIEAYTGPSYYAGDNHGKTATSTVPLTDGFVPGAGTPNIADIVGVVNGDLKWNLPAPEEISEIRIFSRWFDGGRDGINVKRVAYKVAGGDNSWITIVDSSNRGSVGLNDNNTSGALYAILKDTTDTALCANAIALYIQFGTDQDNKGTGYVEIEAVRYRPLSPFTILSSVNTGSALRLEVAFDGAFAGCPITVCSGASDGEDVLANWTTSSSIDSIGASETSRFITVPYDAGTDYFRLLTTRGGKDYWSDAIVLSDCPVVSAAAPVVAFGDVLSTTADSATLTANVVNPGDGYSACDLVLAYGTDPSALTHTNVFANKPAGTATVTLGGLMPNRTYYGAFRAENADASSAETSVFTFRTADFVSPSASYLPASLPGLWQGVFTNDTEGYTDNNGKYDLANADSVNREPGAVMAYLSNRANPQGHTCDFDGTERTFKWTGDTTYVYEGYIWLDATEYVFAAYFWDYVYLKIDDDLLLNQRIDWGVPVRSRTYETAGWHRFVLRGSNTGNSGDVNNCGSIYGGAGNCYLAGANIAITYSTDPDIIAIVKPLLGGADPGINGGAVPLRSASLSQFLDETGTFLRTANPLRTITVEAFSTTGGTLAADLAFGNDVPGDYDLCIAYGATRGGDDPASWENTAAVATIPVSTDTYAYTGLTGAGTSVKYARFYFTDGDAVRWGDDLYLPDPADVALAMSVSVDAHLGDTLVVSGTLVSSGSGATAAVSALVGTQADLSDAVVWPLGTYAAGDAVSGTLHESDTTAAAYIQPGETYYVALVAEDANGAKDRTDAVAVTPPAGAVLADSVSATADFWTATFTGSLDVFGVGDTTTVTLLTGPSADALTNTASTVMDAAGPVSFTVTFSTLGNLYYQLRADNACATASFSDTSSVGTVTLKDASTYYWKADVASGAWNDAANWEVIPANPQLTFPNSTDCTASFANRGAMPTTVSLDGSYTVRTLDFGSANADIAFEADSASDGILAANRFSMQAGTRLTIRSARVQCATEWDVPTGVRCTILDEGFLYVDHTNYESIHFMSGDTRCELRGRSTLQTSGHISTDGPDVRLVIDDSTIRCGYYFVPARGANAVSNVVEFLGAAPKFTINGACTAAWDNPATPRDAIFLFHVPLEGYAEAPIQRTGNSFVFAAERNHGGDIRFEIAGDSPIFQSGRNEPLTVPLLSWTTYGMDPQYIDLDDQPRRSLTSFTYTWGNNNALSGNGYPTGLWATLQSCGATILLFR